MVKNTILEINGGTKQKVVFDITSDYQMPVWIVKGTTAGKTLVISAGVHGCEYVGIEAARTFFQQVDACKISGTIIILPLINSEGFYGGLKQVFPSDNKNLNREFPANSDTITSIVANWIVEEIYPLADCILDLHSGDINEDLRDLIFYSVAVKEELAHHIQDLCMHLPLDLRVKSTSNNGLYSYASSSGIPSLLIEIGCAARFSKTQVQKAITCIERALGYYDMGYQKIFNENQMESVESKYIEAITNGFWYPSVTAGKKVTKGQLLGELKDLDGNTIDSIVSEHDGMIWYLTYTLGVNKNDPLIAYGSYR